MLKTELRIFTIKIAVEMIENDMLRDNRRRMRAIKNKKITNKPIKKNVSRRQVISKDSTSSIDSKFNSSIHIDGRKSSFHDFIESKFRKKLKKNVKKSINELKLEAIREFRQKWQCSFNTTNKSMFPAQLKTPKPTIYTIEPQRKLKNAQIAAIRTSRNRSMLVSAISHSPPTRISF